MKKTPRYLLPGLLILMALACNLPSLVAPTNTPGSSSPTFEPSPVSPESPVPVTLEVTVLAETEIPLAGSAVASPSPPAQDLTQVPSPTLNNGEGKNEAILIREPGPGSRLLSPVHLSGEADSVFEQTLGVRIVQEDGTVLALGPVFIESELGQRGPFSIDIPIEVKGEHQAVIQVFSSSPRDGGITHLASVGVLLADEGQALLAKVDPHPERIQVTMPVPGDPVSSGTVHVEGIAVASFEQTLVVEVQDQDGNVIGALPLTVQSPEMGQPGPFSIDVPYEASASGPGRIVVRDPSPAFEVDLHVASVEVNLAP